MIIRLIKYFEICFLILILMTGFCYGQKVNDTQIDFIKVYSTLSCPIPPFVNIETEISNNQICYRNILPSKHKMNKEHLDVYGSWDTKPKYRKIETADYDSIVDFIMTSGLLNIDLDYAKPDTASGLIMEKTGACTFGYVIETSYGKLDLLISGMTDFKLPDILVDFDRLFKRISRRYYDRNE